MKIIEISPGYCQCMICGKRSEEVRKISINRTAGKCQNIVCFDLCNDCLRKMAQELRPYT